jgi:OmpA-OmpF porin, OOP family
MKYIRILSFALLVLQASNLKAQNDSTNWKAINLGPTVNSTAIEINPSISADGKTLYYVREQHDKNVNHQDIWVSELDENGKWKEARRLEKPLNTGDVNSVASVSINGNELFIKGFYKKGKYAGLFQ